jgi:hypothetical protein
MLYGWTLKQKMSAGEGRSGLGTENKTNKTNSNSGPAFGAWIFSRGERIQYSLDLYN